MSFRWGPETETCQWCGEEKPFGVPCGCDEEERNWQEQVWEG